MDESERFRSALRERIGDLAASGGGSAASSEQIADLERLFGSLPEMYRVFLEEYGEADRRNFSQNSFTSSEVVERNEFFGRALKHAGFDASTAVVVGSSTSGYPIYFRRHDLGLADPTTWIFVDDVQPHEEIDAGPFSQFVLQLIDEVSGRG